MSVDAAAGGFDGAVVGRALAFSALAMCLGAAARDEAPARPYVVMLSPDAAIDHDTLGRIADALTARIGRTVVVRRASSTFEIIETARGSSVDVWFMPTHLYLFTHDDLGVDAALRTRGVDGDDGDTVAFRGRLDDEDRVRLLRALRGLARDDERFRELTGIARFVPATESFYAAARRQLRESGTEIPDVIENGWYFFHLHRQPPLDIVP